MDSFISLVTSINNFVWGPVMLVLLVGTGLYLNVILRFFSFRNWMHAFHCLWQGREHQSEKGEISPWNALMTALAGDIGTGNIVGVATALAIGGPGALFWMWVTALVGMMTKFAEIILAMKYREKTPSGRWVGGAMYFIRNGLGRKWAWMGVFFSVFGIIACVGTGNLVQVNAIAVSLQNTFSVPTWVTGIVLLFLLSLILLGGVKRIGAVAGRLVPFMAAIYIVFALIVIAMNITEVPRVFWWVISEAFTPTSAQGGFAGATVLLTIRMGVARGIFSNEAGLGTGSIAHACADTRKPVKQGMFGIFEVFADTIVICTLTAMVILCSGVPVGYGAAAGAELTIAGFTATYGGFTSTYGSWVSIFTAVAMCCFAFSTAVGWGLYGARCIEFLFGSRVNKPFMLVYALVAIVGATMDLGLLWNIADTFNGLMSIPNLIALLILSGQVKKLAIDVDQAEKSGTL